MAASEIMALMPEAKLVLAGHPVSKAWLFGSFSRGEDTENSDVDILVRYEKDAKITLFTISRLALALKKIFKRNVDVVEEGCVLPFAQSTVDRDKILVYERAN
mgnify:FL=1